MIVEHRKSLVPTHWMQIEPSPNLCDPKDRPQIFNCFFKETSLQLKTTVQWQLFYQWQGCAVQSHKTPTLWEFNKTDSLFLYFKESKQGCFDHELTAAMALGIRLAQDQANRYSSMEIGGGGSHGPTPVWGALAVGSQRGRESVISGVMTCGWLLMLQRVMLYADVHMGSTNWTQRVFKRDKDVKLGGGGGPGRLVGEEREYLWSKYIVCISEITKEK